jgi:hypothetical protein
MKFIDYLNEEYLTRHGDFEIFINPTSKELKEVQGNDQLFVGVRFIADKSTNKIFVSGLTFYHTDFLEYLVHKKYIKEPKHTKWEWDAHINDMKYFMGAGVVNHGKITIDSLSYDFDQDKTDILTNYKWTEKYFNNFKQFVSGPTPAGQRYKG